MSNTHGWETIGRTGVGGLVAIAPIVDQRKRCACSTAVPCQREATQEDVLCDECRAACR